MSCDALNTYNSRDVSTAAVSAFFSGIAGLIGAGGFWTPTDSDALTAETNDMSTLQDQWQKILDRDKAKLTTAQTQFANDQIELMKTSQDFRDELFDERITKNTLFIQILFGIITVIIIYLMVL